MGNGREQLAQGVWHFQNERRPIVKRFQSVGPVTLTLPDGTVLILKPDESQAMNIPPELLESLERYVTHGIPTGSFLRACLENNFVNAVCRADESTTPYLRAIAQHIHNELPSDCHGSPEAVRAWLARLEFAGPHAPA